MNERLTSKCSSLFVFTLFLISKLFVHNTNGRGQTSTTTSLMIFCALVTEGCFWQKLVLILVWEMNNKTKITQTVD